MLATYAHAVAGQTDRSLTSALELALNGQVAAVDAMAAKALADKARWLEVQAIAHYYDGDGKAPAMALEAAKLAPQDAHIGETEILFCTRNRAQAAAYLTRARRFAGNNPEDGRAYASLGVCYQYLGEGNPEDAFNKAVDLSPADFEVNYFAATYFWRTTQQPKAAAAFDRLVNTHPKSAMAYKNRGEYRRDQFDLKNAAADLKRVGELNQAIAPSGHLAKSFRKSGNYEEAIKVFTQIIQKKPDGNSFGRRAECYMKLNRLEDALKDYDQALKLYSPAHDEKLFDVKDLEKMSVTQRLAYEKYWLYRIELKDRLGKRKEAIADATQFLKVRPNSESCLDLRQKLLYETGDYPGALRDVSRLITVNQYDEAYYHHRAAIYEKLGKRAEAEADKKHAANLNETGSPE